MGGVLVVVNFLMGSMVWGIVELLLLRKEMVVSDGWDGRSWNFLGWLLMSSPSHAGIWMLQLCFVAHAVGWGDLVEEMSVV